jgi:vacuolar-type H+-ATPase subunit I/STV1
MVKRREEDEVEKAEAALRRAQVAQKRAEKAERKPFLDEVKQKKKEIKDFYSKRKHIWKVVFSELKMVGRVREKKAAGEKGGRL